VRIIIPQGDNIVFKVHTGVRNALLSRAIPALLRKVKETPKANIARENLVMTNSIR